MLPRGLSDRGVQAALLSAVLFGASTPTAKTLLGHFGPWLLAGLLYTGSGLGLLLVRRVRRAPRVHLKRPDVLPLVGAISAGGIAAPLLLLVGLTNLPASGASLLLNAEAVFTAVLAWLVFHEHFDRRIALGMLAIVAGAVVLSVPSGAGSGRPVGVLAILAACLCWGLDNNLTRMVALHDATWLAAIKGGVAGPVNLAIAFALGAQLPAVLPTLAALATGFVSYGLSLALFIVGMRHVGAARAGAYSSVAPFFGALLAIVLGDPITLPLLGAGALMALGVWLHLAERHEHEHTHDAITHDHWHTHDEHHRHAHEPPVPAGTWHRHEHTHEPTTHAHEHYPDAHHRHGHPSGHGRGLPRRTGDPPTSGRTSCARPARVRGEALRAFAANALVTTRNRARRFISGPPEPGTGTRRARAHDPRSGDGGSS